MRQRAWITALPLLLLLAAAAALVLLGRGLQDRHEATVAATQQRSILHSLSDDLRDLASREARRPASDFAPLTANGGASPLVTGSRESLILAYAEIAADGSRSSPLRAAGAAEAAILRARGGPLPAASSAALDLILPRLAAARASFADALPPVTAGSSEPWLGSYGLVAVAGDLALARRCLDLNSEPRLQVLLLDPAALLARLQHLVAGQSGLRLRPAGLPSTSQVWRFDQLPIAELPERLAVVLETDAVGLTAAAGTRHLSLLWWSGGAAIALAAALLYWGHRQTRRLLNAQRTFTAAASHELRTPVAALQALTENLLDGAVTDPQRQVLYLQHLHQESRRLAALVGNLLDHSRIERGGVHLQREAGCLPRVLREVAARFELPPPELPTTAEACAADPAALERMLVNLLDNCRKYAGAAPPELCVEPAPGVIRLLVRDFGPGIANDQLRRVRQAWQRGDGSEARPGLGLGLSLVDGLARAHGGTLELSNHPAGGLLAVVALPLSPDPAGDSGTGSRSAAVRSEGKAASSKACSTR